MATTLNTQTLVDTNKRALVKVVCLFDGTAQTQVRVVDTANLAFALNTAGYIKGTGANNVNAKSLYRTTIKRVFGQGNFTSGYATLTWGGTGNANSQIVTLGDGQFDYNFDAEGLSASIPIQYTANSTGVITMNTTGLTANDAVTFFVDLRKDSADYDAGQTRDPTAFNRGYSL